MSQTPEPQSSPTPNVANQPIRSVDFCKVGFPHYPVYSDRSTKYITLKLGNDCGVEPTYGDVTGDGVDEAMLSLGIENRGSAILEIVYVFPLLTVVPKFFGLSNPVTERRAAYAASLQKMATSWLN